MPSARKFQFQLRPSRIRFVATNLIVKKGITDVFCDFGHGLDIVLRFLVALNADAIAQLVPGIPDELQSASKE